MTDTFAQQSFQAPPAPATVANVMRPPVTTVEQAAHVVADGKDVNSTRIYQVMTTRPTVINTTTSIRDAAEVMTSGHFRHLPVVGDAGLAGIVDITDVCRALIDPDFSQLPWAEAAKPA